MERLWNWRCPLCGLRAIPTQGDVIMHACTSTIWETDESGMLHPTYTTFRVMFDESKKMVTQNIKPGYPAPGR
jgi:rubredoxin